MSDSGNNSTFYSKEREKRNNFNILVAVPCHAIDDLKLFVFFNEINKKNVVIEIMVSK